MEEGIKQSLHLLSESLSIKYTIEGIKRKDKSPKNDLSAWVNYDLDSLSLPKIQKNKFNAHNFKERIIPKRTQSCQLKSVSFQFKGLEQKRLSLPRRYLNPTRNYQSNIQALQFHFKKQQNLSKQESKQTYKPKNDRGKIVSRIFRRLRKIRQHNKLIGVIEQQKIQVRDKIQ